MDVFNRQRRSMQTRTDQLKSTPLHHLMLSQEYCGTEIIRIVNQCVSDLSLYQTSSSRQKIYISLSE